MFDYSSGFAASGKIGNYNFNIGQAYPYGWNTTYPVTGGVQFGQDNTMLYVLLAVVAVVILSK